MIIKEVIDRQKIFFQSQQSKDVAFRKASLIRLKTEIQKREDDIILALQNDFKKPPFETIISETGIILNELNTTIRNIHKWTKPKTVIPSLLNFPSRDRIFKQPFGQVLIMAPWNYPFQLALAPLIGAVASGNTVVLKPSELTSNTSHILSEIVREVFSADHVVSIEGGVDVAQELLAQRWDYIFFTGSVYVGKIVAKAAAEHLTPTTLELGGKNPCIIDDSANIKLAAKRIAWGKFLNGGQTCVAPDYILIHKKVKTEFVDFFAKEIKQAYGENPKESRDFPRIVNQKNYDRLCNMLVGENCIFGGVVNENELYISPTLVDEPAIESEIMKGEIFGPLLPIISYESSTEIDNIVSRYPNPLSLYIFSIRNQFAREVINKYSFGGGTINDTVLHFVNPKLPFGGVGTSGMGAYHGKRSFDTFTHQKSITRHYNWLDIPIRYAPYKGKLGLIKKVIKWLG